MDVEIFYVIVSVLFLIFACLLIYMYKEAHTDRTIVHQLSFPDFPVSFNRWSIFLISDIHRRTVSEKMIANVKDKADIVIIGGDLAEKGVQLQQVEENVRRLCKLGPTYFVWGNNDYELEQTSYRELLMKLGVIILDNRSVQFQSPLGEAFFLVGVDDLSTRGDHLQEALRKVKNTHFKILVSHDPRIIRSVTTEQNIQLLLSGHTHGGQIRIFGFGPYEKGGVKKVGNTTLFVSNGYGTTAVPLRLGAKAETHLITIRHSDSGGVEKGEILGD
ncbi:metallophosphoesterase [Bacillus sp. B15-48]|uniref:metallophosphoesterase n=1 Tax=Bacillus sp. B15-48 TaxID=1548601 RepID=UPI00193FC349|nr:metallophosphoesterase [Bacillus sp. B15-48]MBM4762152.1 metallophosphoesterase [Bacillus sp. B15-48]